MAAPSNMTKNFELHAAVRYLKSHLKPVSFPTPQKRDNEHHILQSDVLRTKKMFMWALEMHINHRC